MNEEDLERQDPDELLADIQKEETKDTKGKLKIFFGMAAGVGKTCEMLKNGQRLYSEGVDVIIGYVETHNRNYTKSLVQGLPAIPRKSISYKNVSVEEMDIDEILLRKPKLVLVDELAHSNTPGMRHPKRYQDVMEILDNGIDVYTTLNIQHLESRADIVESITNIKIWERIPDSILEIANEVELIDLVPDDLLKRLTDGKIYAKDKVETALKSFFQKTNLTALREMSLSFTSKLVDRELKLLSTGDKYQLSERILVAIGANANSENLIRCAKRISFNLQSPWMVAYIDTGRKLQEKERLQISKDISLARELGAEIVTIQDENVVSGILKLSRQNKITQIVIGKTKERFLSRIFLNRSITNELIRKSENININIIPEKIETKEFLNLSLLLDFSFNTNQYLLGIGTIFLVTIGCLFLLPFTGYWTIALILLFVVTGLALFIGRGPVLISAGLSACLWNFLFIPPRFTFYIDKLEDGMMFIVYFFIATILGSLTNRLRTKESAIRLREGRIVSLYNFSQLLARSHSMKDIVKATVSFIDESLEAKCCIILKDEKENLSNEVHEDSNLVLTEKEKAVALWAFKNKKPAGRFTDTLPLSEGYYIPLLTAGNAIGVIGLVIKDNEKLTLDKEALLQTFTSQIAIAIERIYLGKTKQRALMLEESERLYKILLNSVSHEFRTPLTAIRGSVNLLLDGKNSEEINHSLLNEIHTAYEKLNRLVDNLLDMSRLESGMIKLNLEWHDITDLISVVLKRLEHELSGKEIKLEISDSLPLVRIDFILMEQVISNLLYNAVIHTPSDTKITIRVTIPRTDLTIMIEDNGPGFVGIDTERIFDKFYQGKYNKSGIGLGLSICKGLVEIHGGKILAENIPEGGARFIIRLPVITFPYPLDEELEK